MQQNNHFNSIILLSLSLEAKIVIENKMQLIAHPYRLVLNFNFLMITHKVLVISAQKHQFEV